MFNPIKAILFDCDGTIVDSEHAHFSSWRLALQKHGSDISLESFHSYVGTSGEGFAIAHAKILAKDCKDELIADKASHYLAHVHRGLPPIHHTVALIKQLAKEKELRGYKMAVASAAPKIEVLLHLKHLGIIDLFDVIISGRDDLHGYSDPEGVNKPKPYIYLHTAKQLSVSPSECIVIEDSSTGVTAGVDAGCFTIAIPNSFSRQQDFSRAALLLESLEDVDIDEFFNLIRSAVKSK